MFRKTISALLGATMLAGLGLAASPASAGTSKSWEVTSRGWEIDAHDDATCSAYRKYEGGAAVMLGWRTEDKSFWLAFGRDGWGAHLKHGQTYNITFTTDGRHWNGGEFKASNKDGNHAVLLSGATLTWPFVEALAKANTVGFLLDGKRILGLQLDGSWEALAKTLECQKAQNARGGSPQSSVTPAPSQAPAPKPILDASGASWTVALQDNGTSTVVAGTLNNTVPVQFMLDTGATGVSITRAMAQQIGAKVVRHVTVVYADGRRGNEPMVVIPRLTIGSVTVTNIEATLSEGSPLLGKSFLDVFSSYHVDNRQATLVLKR